jgi:hypothetical protein
VVDDGAVAGGDVLAAAGGALALEDGEGLNGEGFACPPVGRGGRVEQFDPLLVGGHEFVGAGGLGAEGV